MNVCDRRDFIAVGGAAIGAFTAPAIGKARVAEARFRSSIVIGDTRFATSRAFADAVAKSGARIVWTAGDVTDFWRDELDLLWRQQKVSLAGLTTRTPFFYLERLALDRGLRVATASERFESAQRLVVWVIAKPRRATA